MTFKFLYTIEYLIRNNASIIVTGSIDLTGTRDFLNFLASVCGWNCNNPMKIWTYYGRGPFETTSTVIQARSSGDMRIKSTISSIGIYVHRKPEIKRMFVGWLY